MYYSFPLLWLQMEMIRCFAVFAQVVISGLSPQTLWHSTNLQIIAWCWLRFSTVCGLSAEWYYKWLLFLQSTTYHRSNKTITGVILFMTEIKVSLGLSVWPKDQLIYILWKDIKRLVIQWSHAGMEMALVVIIHWHPCKEEPQLHCLF